MQKRGDEGCRRSELSVRVYEVVSIVKLCRDARKGGQCVGGASE